MFSFCHISSRTRAASQLFPSPSHQPTRAPILILYLCVFLSMRGVNRGVVDQNPDPVPRSRALVTETGIGDGEGCSSDTRQAAILQGTLWILH